MPNIKEVLTGAVGVVVVLALLIGIPVGIYGVYKGVQRYQRRADANNRVQVTAINIRNANQQALVVRAEIAATKAQAEKRYQESIGIRRAQDEIARTLTPLYVQHEAIQAQREGGAGDRTYIPVGAQGVPLVADISGKNAAVPAAK